MKIKTKNTAWKKWLVRFILGVIAGLVVYGIFSLPLDQAPEWLIKSQIFLKFFFTMFTIFAFIFEEKFGKAINGGHTKEEWFFLPALITAIVIAIIFWYNYAAIFQNLNYERFYLLLILLGNLIWAIAGLVLGFLSGFIASITSYDLISILLKKAKEIAYPENS